MLDCEQGSHEGWVGSSRLFLSPPQEAVKDGGVADQFPQGPNVHCDTRNTSLSNEKSLCVPAKGMVAGSRIWTLKKRRAKLSGRNGVGFMPILEGGRGSQGFSAGLGRETPLHSTLSVFCRSCAPPAIVQRFKNKGFLAWTLLMTRGTVPAQGTKASGR